MITAGGVALKPFGLLFILMYRFMKIIVDIMKTG